MTLQEIYDLAIQTQVECAYIRYDCIVHEDKENEQRMLNIIHYWRVIAAQLEAINQQGRPYTRIFKDIKP